MSRHAAPAVGRAGGRLAADGAAARAGRAAAEDLAAVPRARRGRRGPWLARGAGGSWLVVVSLSLVLLGLQHLAAGPHKQHWPGAAAAPVGERAEHGDVLPSALPTVVEAAVFVPDTRPAVQGDGGLASVEAPEPATPGDVAVACLAVLSVALVVTGRLGVGWLEPSRAGLAQWAGRGAGLGLRARPGPLLLLEKCVRLGRPAGSPGLWLRGTERCC
jgi:hypothetical protein